MAYTKQTWADLPSKTTPINAERLTHIEDGIFNAAQTADTAASTAGTAAANVGIVSGRVETLTGRVNDLDTAVSNKVVYFVKSYYQKNRTYNKKRHLSNYWYN